MIINLRIADARFGSVKSDISPLTDISNTGTITYEQYQRQRTFDQQQKVERTVFGASQVVAKSVEIKTIEGPGDFSDPACKDQPELFFSPSRNETSGERQIREATAKLICRQCIHIKPCAQWAKEKREVDGIWGGQTEQERRHPGKFGRS